jgi:hypothetical protein
VAQQGVAGAPPINIATKTLVRSLQMRAKTAIVTTPDRAGAIRMVALQLHASVTPTTMAPNAQCTAWRPRRATTMAVVTAMASVLASIRLLGPTVLAARQTTTAITVLSSVDRI